jgi:uncharacterized protein
MEDTLIVTPRTRLRRLPERARPERAARDAILDEGLICHVAFVHEGSPVVLPQGYGREGDTLYLHGSSGGRLYRTLAAGAPLCVTVTLVDGLVMARSAFHHSMNYRSVVVFGHARQLEGKEKEHGLRVVTEHLAPGRWDEVRPMTRKELSATIALALPLDEASVKVREGWANDEPEDVGLPIWAGVVPLAQVTSGPLTNPDVPDDLPLAPSARNWAEHGPARRIRRAS